MFSSFDRSKNSIIERIRQAKFTEALVTLKIVTDPRRRAYCPQDLLEVVCTAVTEEYRTTVWLTRELKAFLHSLDDLLVSFKQLELRSKLYCNLATVSTHANELGTSEFFLRTCITHPHCGSTPYTSLCAVYNALGEHLKAFKCALDAVRIAETEFLRVKMSPDASEKAAELLAVAYYNLAAEYEFKNRKSSAAEYFRKAYEYLAKHGPLNSAYLSKFKQAAGHPVLSRTTSFTSRTASHRSLTQTSSRVTRQSLVTSGDQCNKQKLLPLINSIPARHLPPIRMKAKGWLSKKHVLYKIDTPPPQPSPDKQEPVESKSETPVPDLAYVLGPLTALQAAIRGQITRDRIHAHLQPRLVFRKWWRLDEQDLMTSVYKNDVHGRITVSSVDFEAHLDFGLEEDYADLLKRLRLLNGQLVITKPAEHFDEQFKTSLQLAGQMRPAEILIKKTESLLVVKTTVGQEPLQYRETVKLPGVCHDYMEYAKANILPFLELSGTVLYKRCHSHEEELIGKATLNFSGESYTVLLESITTQTTTVICATAEGPVKTLSARFSLDKVLESLSMKTPEEFFETPQFLFLALTVLNGSRLELLPSSALDKGHEYFCLKEFNEQVYKLYCYVFEQKKAPAVCIVPCGTPLIECLVLTAERLVCLRTVSLHDFPVIIANLRVKDNRFCFQQARHSVKLTMTYRKAAMLIQTHYRSYIQRKQSNLKRQQQKRAKLKPLVLRRAKILQNEPYIISVYQLEEGYLMESQNIASLQLFTLIIPDVSAEPQFLIDRMTIVNDSITCGGVVVHSDSTWMKRRTLECSAKRPMNGKMYTVTVCREAINEVRVSLTSGSESVSQVFSHAEIKEVFGYVDLEHLSSVVSLSEFGTIELLSGINQLTAIVRRSKRVGSNLHSVVVKTIKKGLYVPSDRLTIEAWKGSNALRALSLTIELGEAAQYSGFQVNQIVPIANILITHALIIEEDAISINYSALNSASHLSTTKLQSWMRGVHVRLLFANAYVKLVSRKIMVGTLRVSCVLFKEPKCLALVCVSGLKTWRFTFDEMRYKQFRSSLQAFEKLILPSLKLNPRTQQLETRLASPIKRPLRRLRHSLK